MHCKPIVDSNFVTIFKSYLHSNGKHTPNILVHFINLNAVVDLLLSASKEPSKSIDELIINGTGT